MVRSSKQHLVRVVALVVAGALALYFVNVRLNNASLLHRTTRSILGSISPHLNTPALSPSSSQTTIASPSSTNTPTLSSPSPPPGVTYFAQALLLPNSLINPKYSEWDAWVELNVSSELGSPSQQQQKNTLSDVVEDNRIVRAVQLGQKKILVSAAAQKYIAQLNPRVVVGLFEDIAPWVSPRKVDVASMYKFASKYFSKVALYVLHEGDVTHAAGLSDTVNYYEALAALKRIATENQHLRLPPIPILLNSFDEPMNEMDCKDKPTFRKYHGTWDQYPEGEAKGWGVPVWSRTKLVGCHEDIMYPMNEMLEGVVEAEERRGRGGAHDMAWEDKLNVAFWRGCSTGFGTVYNNARVRLIRAVREFEARHAHLPRNATDPKFAFDVGLHVFCQNIDSSSFDDPAEADTFLLPSVPFDSFKLYKYLVDIDGNSYSRRLMGLMMMGSTVVRVGMFTDIVSRTLEEGVHYVRASMDMTDLFEKIEWLVDHDEEARRLAEDGKEYFMKNFRYEDVYNYLAALTMLYASNVDFVGTEIVDHLQ